VCIFAGEYGQCLYIPTGIYETYGNRHVAVGVGLNSVDNGSESSSRGSVGTDSSRRVDILEEGKRDRSNRNRANLLPLVDGIVKLLSGSESVEVPTTLVLVHAFLRNEIDSPRVTVVVRVLGVSADSNTRTLSDTLVDVVDGAERISDNLVVGESLVTARLESGRIARGSRIKDVDAGQNRVCVLTRSTTSSVGEGIGAGPVGLEEAKDKRSLRDTVGARLSKLSGKVAALDQSTVLDSGGEEGRAVNLFPQIKSGVVPVLSDIRQIVLDDGPDDVVDGSGVAIGLHKG
jgi:hypothetical protein